MDIASSSIILFVINPVSGGIVKTDYPELIRNHFIPTNHVLHFHILSGKDDTNDIVKIIEKTVPNIVVAVGGDGTISLIAKIIIDTAIQLGIIPSGSANGMALELNIPFTLPKAIELIKNGKSQKIDILKINNKICLHLSDIGINAQLIKYFEQGKIRGKIGYALVVLKTLFRKKTIFTTIQTDTIEIKRTAFMVVLANASKYGTGAVINPLGDLYDGLFEVIIIKKLSLLTLYKMWFKPSSFTSDHIEVFQAKAVTVEANRKIHFQIDGEYIGKVQYIRAEILPQQLNILLPD